MIRIVLERFQTSPVFYVFLCVFLIRISVALFVTAPLISDDGDYHSIGLAVSHGEGFIRNGQPSAFRAPGYPAFLGTCYSIFGASPLATRCVQAVCDTLTCMFCFLIGVYVFGRRTAILAAAMLAVFPLQVLYITRTSTETVCTLLLLLNIWLMVRVWKTEGGWIQVFLVGLILGVSTLVRPTAVFLLPVAAWFFWERVRLKIDMLRLSLFIVTFTVVISPWMLRNEILFGRFALTSTTGINLWIGNNPHANGGYSFPKEDNPLEQEQDEFKQSDLGAELSFRYVTHHPLDYVLLIPKKIAHFLSSDYQEMIFLQYRPEWTQPSITASLYNELSLPLWLLLHLPYATVMILGILGMVCHAGGRTKAEWLLILVLVSFLVMHLVFFGDARFRVPIMPLVILFAASGWQNWRMGVLRFRGWRRRAVLLFIAGFFAIWIAEYVTLQSKLRLRKGQNVRPVVQYGIIQQSRTGRTSTGDLPDDSAFGSG